MTSLAHCRICGYAPRPPRSGELDFRFEKIIEHIEEKHPRNALGFLWEAQMLRAQTQGDDSMCEFHGQSVKEEALT
jgi:hypothetical protein